MTEQYDLQWQDYYEILQISAKAEPDVIECTFRKLATKYHPDKSSGNGESMRLINEAYAVLHDADRRQRYDAAYLEQRRRSESSVSRAAEDAQRREREERERADAALKQEEKRRKQLERELAAARRNGAKRRAEQAEQQVQVQSAPRSNQQAHEAAVSPWVEFGLGVLQALTEQRDQQRVDLTGQWYRLGDDMPHWIEQHGDTVYVHARNALGIVVLNGQGTFDGRYLRLQFEYLADVPSVFGIAQVPQAGSAVCEVDSTGRWIRGPATLYR